ncbi:MAG: hypothetical protein GC192_05810 [Bacteroidetes bacterium]|nr:hypothetical protein [Bacteroidota bacterium]
MKKLFYFIILISLASCQGEDIIGPSGTINLNINAEYNGQPLVIGQAYTYDGANQIQFDQFNFFISNVTLLEAETEDETDLLDVDLADFSSNTTPGNVQPVSFEFRTVPAVKYEGLKISFGVAAGSNKASANSFGAGYPLKKAFDSHWWADGNSFFFMKLSGKYNTDKSFELFPAKNENFMTVTFQKNFTLEDGKSFDLDLSVDVLKLLQDANNQPIDFTNPANLSTYNPVNGDLSALLMDNFDKDKALKLN